MDILIRVLAAICMVASITTVSGAIACDYFMRRDMADGRAVNQKLAVLGCVELVVAVWSVYLLLCIYER